jgi:hypothetical protein
MDLDVVICKLRPFYSRNSLENSLRNEADLVSKGIEPWYFTTELFY